MVRSDSTTRLSQKFKGEIWDSITELELIADRTGVSFEWLRKGEPSDDTMAHEPHENFTGNKTFEKLEKLVSSQQRTITILEQRLKRLEESFERITK